jgi:copper chaperone NosL
MLMRRSSRWVVTLASALLLALYVTPLWRIQLYAPQYPEGLGLRIWVGQITGAKPNDLNSINGLNHYIGMHAIEPGDFPELRLMPWLLAGLIAGGLIVALIGRRGPLYVWLQLIALGAVAGLVDFYRWGYTYGHELDEHAAIKVPGMSYQPPVIGTKQLLNFHASSWPDLGAWIAALSLAIGVTVAILEWRRSHEGRPEALSPLQPGPTKALA